MVIGYNFGSLPVKGLCAHDLSNDVLPLIVLVMHIYSNCYIGR